MTKRIVLADDSAAARKSVEKALGTDDLQLVIAEDGNAAMEQIGSVRPHLVLAHAMLPGMDGYDVCRQVKENPETSHIPVFLLTGTFEPFDINRAKEANYDGFVTKPLDGNELQSLVQRAIDSAVYPAEPEPVAEPEPAPEEAETVEIEAPVIEPEPVAAAEDGSNEMLDRIFPEEPLEAGDTVVAADQPEEELFSVVETEETPAADSTADDAPVPAEENSDLSWFLRKYEEKETPAEEAEPEPLTADEPAAPVEPEAPALEAIEPLPEAEPLIAEPEPALEAGPVQLNEEQLEQVVRLVAERVSKIVIRDVVWEAVPEIAERLIRERIREIEAEAETE